MTRALLFAFLVLLYCATPARAQFTLVSGTVTDPNGLPWACGTISAQLVNNNGISATLNGVSFSASTAPVKLGCPTDPTTSRTPGFFQMQLADNTVIKCGITTCGTQTTWQFTANTTGILPPQGTGPQSFTQSFTISGTSQTLSFSSVPALSSNSIPSSGAQGISVAQALTFSPFNRKVDWSCTTSNGSAIVSGCANAQFTSANVGNRAFATTLAPGGFGGFALATTVCGSTAGTTILSVQSATQVTLSNNCSGSNSGGPFVWGPDEIGVASGCTTAVAVSGTCTGISGLITVAALNCGMINWPSAAAIVSSTPFANPPTTNCANPVGAQRTGVGIIGASPTVSQLTPTPDFNMVLCNLGTAGNACTGANGSGSSGGYVLEDFSWNGFGVNPTAAAPHTMIELEANTYATHVYCLGIGATNTNITGYRWGIVPVNGVDVQADGCGAIPSNFATTGTGGATCDQCYFGDSAQGSLVSGTLYSTKTIWGPVETNNNHVVNVGGSGGALFNSSQDDFIGGGNGATQGSLVQVSGLTAAAILNNDTLPDGRTSAASLFCNSATGSITLTGRNTINAIGTTEQSFFGISGCTLNDFGPTKWSQTSVNTYPTGTVYQGLPGTSVLNGSCSGVATAASTLGFFGLGQLTAQTCTSTTVNVGTVMSKPGNLAAILVTAGTGGTNASSGVVTILKNNVTTILTCTIGTGTSCTDTTHNVSVVAGDIISAQFTTQAADTLANPKITVVLQGTT